MSKFKSADIVKVVKVASWPNDNLIGKTGIVTSTHDEWSYGSTICPHISVDLGHEDGEYRFYTDELEFA